MIFRMRFGQVLDGRLGEKTRLRRMCRLHNVGLRRGSFELGRRNRRSGRWIQWIRRLWILLVILKGLRFVRWDMYSELVLCCLVGRREC
jgi:hypothetical protein